MAITLANQTRNAACAAETALANGGTLRLRSAGGDTLCDIPLEATAFQAPSDGVAVATGGDGTNPIGEGNPLEGVGAAAASTGTACTNYQVLDSSEGLVWSGSVGTSGADMIVPNTSIAENQPVKITSFTHTVPATQS